MRELVERTAARSAPPASATRSRSTATRYDLLDRGSRPVAGGDPEQRRRAGRGRPPQRLRLEGGGRARVLVLARRRAPSACGAPSASTPTPEATGRSRTAGEPSSAGSRSGWRPSPAATCSIVLRTAPAIDANLLQVGRPAARGRRVPRGRAHRLHRRPDRLQGQPSVPRPGWSERVLRVTGNLVRSDAAAPRDRRPLRLVPVLVLPVAPSFSRAGRMLP